MILNRFLMSSTKQKPNILVVKVFKETLRDLSYIVSRYSVEFPERDM